jgi:regulation of enolase protein 1 (concanavalin A-like superfamily)
MPNPFDDYSWLNPPEDFTIDGDQLNFRTMPETDFWQRTYYGFRNDNAHAFLFSTDQPHFTYCARVRYAPEKLYDQAGILLRVNADHWCKAAIEVEDAHTARLGSVVTNFGYSDWASVDIPNAAAVQQYYRLSRRGQDFRLENSTDGLSYQQMRIFHLYQAAAAVQVGVYACSPTQSSFEVTFSEIDMGDCLWEAYS